MDSLIVTKTGKSVSSPTKRSFFRATIATQVYKGPFGHYWAKDWTYSYKEFKESIKSLKKCHTMATIYTCARMYINSDIFAYSELEIIDNIQPYDLKGLVFDCVEERKLRGVSDGEIILISKLIYNSYFPDSECKAEDFH